MWFIYWDACGLACFIIGISTVLLVDFVTVFHVIRPWFGLYTVQGLLHALGFQVAIVCILLSYLRAAMTDPGSVEMRTATDADIYPTQEGDPEAWMKMKRRFCHKCKCIKPPRAHHCSTCHRCINKMDHHCPWVNNCVGSNNMKFFLLFLFWTFLGSAYAATIAIWRIVVCWRGRCAIPALPVIVLGVFSTVMAIFFAIFVVAMMWDQYTGVTTDTTAIEAMKGWEETPRSLRVGLEDAFGEPFGWRWFFPVRMPESSPSFYRWKKTDDVDAYDPRDPLVIRHLESVRSRIRSAKRAAAGGVSEAAARVGAAPSASRSADSEGDYRGSSEGESGDESESEGESEYEGDGEEESTKKPQKPQQPQQQHGKGAAAAAAAAAAKPVLSLKSDGLRKRN